MSVAGTSTQPLISVEGLHTYYGKSHILDGVSLHVGPGEVVGLLGRNGVGKSTTLKTIMGIVKPSAGTVMLNGTAIDGLPAHKLARLGIAYVPEDRRIFRLLTVMENLRTGFDRDGVTEERKKLLLDKAFTFFPRLGERRNQPGGTLSGGEQQMLAMARALLSRPKLLLLDEPSMGLSPIMVEKIFEVVREISKEGLTVLLVEQNARLALQAANRGYVMDSGTVTMSGDAKVMLDDPKVRAAYLGE
jgi:branched-chain amino acid transport system ATP-binding protein